jgi:hypothetical protein
MTAHEAPVTSEGATRVQAVSKAPDLEDHPATACEQVSLSRFVAVRREWLVA